jgi:hypothetical protein
MVSQARRFAISSIAVSMLAIGLECTSAEECDYKTCGALMARDGLVSWTVSGRRDYSTDTKRACAELNACVRRAKNNSAGRAPAAPAARSSSLKSSPKGSATDLKPEPVDKQASTSNPSAQSPATQTAAPVTVGNSPATIGIALLPPPSASVLAPENAPNKESPSPPPTPIPD